VSRIRRRADLAALLALVVLTAPSVAHAYERQWHVGLGLGYAYVSGTNAGHGFGGDAYVSYGVSDTINLMLDLGLTAHPGSDRLVGDASAGAVYVFDVFQLIWYGGALVGAYDRLGLAGCGGAHEPGCHEGHLGFSVPIGLDYLLTRNVNIGLQGRYHLLVLGSDAPVHYVTALGRVEYAWGY